MGSVQGSESYKLNPHSKAKLALEEAFDMIFTTKTAGATLNEALKRIHKKKMNSFWEYLEDRIKNIGFYPHPFDFHSFCQEQPHSHSGMSR